VLCTNTNIVGEVVWLDSQRSYVSANSVLIGLYCQLSANVNNITTQMILRCKNFKHVLYDFHLLMKF